MTSQQVGKKKEHPHATPDLQNSLCYSLCLGMLGVEGRLTDLFLSAGLVPCAVGRSTGSETIESYLTYMVIFWFFICCL